MKINSGSKGIRDAFYVDESWCKAAVYGRSVDMILRAGRGLSWGNLRIIVGRHAHLDSQERQPLF
jgi:hypothetical protein